MSVVIQLLEFSGCFLFFAFSVCGKLIRQWWFNTGRITSLLISLIKATENIIWLGLFLQAGLTVLNWVLSEIKIDFGVSAAS